MDPLQYRWITLLDFLELVLQLYSIVTVRLQRRFNLTNMLPMELRAAADLWPNFSSAQFAHPVRTSLFTVTCSCLPKSIYLFSIFWSDTCPRQNKCNSPFPLKTLLILDYLHYIASEILCIECYGTKSLSFSV